MFSPNNLWYPIIVHAVTTLGAVLTTCNPLYTQGTCTLITELMALLAHLQENSQAMTQLHSVLLLGR